MQTDYYKGIQKIYFSRIIKSIISIGSLNNTKKTILDFGCGSQQLQKSLSPKKILNYDIDNKYQKYVDYRQLKFDVVIFNHVLMYMDKSEIEDILHNIKKINKNCEFIFGIGKGNFINKAAAYLSLNFSDHAGAKSNYRDQLYVLKKNTKDAVLIYLIHA